MWKGHRAEMRRLALQVAGIAAVPLLLVGLLGCAAPEGIARDRDEDYSEASLRVPPHQWQAERVNNIRWETIEETMLNLANFDDVHLAETSFSGLLANYVSPDFVTQVVTRFARVRRLFAEGREDPQAVVPGLRRLFREALADWPAAWEEFQARFKNGVAELTEPDRYLKAEKRSLAATYILAEFGDHQALPLMLECYRIHDPGRIMSPVAPGFTLYAMHRLVGSYPEEELSPEAWELREEYLRAAKVLPEAKEITVTTWDAKYHESDPRLTVFGVKEIVASREPTMTMPLYPWRFTDGTATSDFNGQVSPKAKELFQHLERFVESVFPEAKTEQ
jgi:hypothetical protein